MSREFRALGRELRPGSPVRRRSLVARLVGWVLRHLLELLLLVVLVRVWVWSVERIGSTWTGVAAVALVAGVFAWRRSRRWVVAAFGCVVTRSRLRSALIELRLCTRSGRLPLVLALVPSVVGERVWLLCPVGVSAEDLADESDRLRSACLAREVRVTRDRRFSALVLVEVIRRDPLANGAPVRPLVGEVPGGVPSPRSRR